MTPDDLRKLANEATPGPWLVERPPPRSKMHRYIVAGKRVYPYNWSVDGPSWLDSDRGTTEADARLVALAPDLAQLCADMADWIEAETSGFETGGELLTRLEKLGGCPT